MNYRERFKNAIVSFFQNPIKNIGFQDKELLEWLGLEEENKRTIHEVTYYTCLKMLSETLGKMPIKMYQRTENGLEKITNHPVYYLLHVRPNPFMTPTTFWTTVEFNRNHYGNAYVLKEEEISLRKYGGEYKIKNLWIMPSNDVTVLIDNKGIFGNKGELYYQYSDRYSGELFLYKKEKILHFKTWLSEDGILGKSVQEILQNTIHGGLESQRFMNNLYEQGMTASMALQYIGDLDEKKVVQLQQKFEKKLSGAKNAGRIVPVPAGLQLQPLNIKLTDSQFFELKKYTALQIAGAFGIKPNQINDYEKSSYANSESQQLSFLVDTELYTLKSYEEEMNYQLLSSLDIQKGIFIKFNEKVLLRTDMKTQSETLRNLVQGSIYTPNEAREFLDKANNPYGDKLIANGNIIPLSDIGMQYRKEAESNKTV